MLTCRDKSGHCNTFSTSQHLCYQTDAPLSPIKVILFITIYSTSGDPWCCAENAYVTVPKCSSHTFTFSICEGSPHDAPAHVKTIQTTVECNYFQTEDKKVLICSFIIIYLFFDISQLIESVKTAVCHCLTPPLPKKRTEAGAKCPFTHS